MFTALNFLLKFMHIKSEDAAASAASDLLKGQFSSILSQYSQKLSAVTVISVIIDDIAFLKIKTSGKLIIATCLNQFFLFTALTELLAQSINLLKKQQFK